MITPLEAWIRKKTAPGETRLTRQALEMWQLEAIRQTVAYAKSFSPFYRDLLAGAEPVDSFADFKRLPFTYPGDIKAAGTKMVCVKQNEIARIVTLATSGTTGLSKRIYFTEEDQELTTDFFHHGMCTFTNEGDRVLILLPGQTPGSIGDLLKKGLKRIPAEGIVYGVVDDPEKVQSLILEKDIHVVVGIPQQVYAVSRRSCADEIMRKGFLHSVLLSTDYVPNALAGRIRGNWGCEVYEHYGMTETGLGGGVFCKAQTGYHMREADLYYEIVDPVNGMPVEDGLPGEVVFTTLTRKGMPLIRYRTGDIARFIKEPCPCGTVLKTMEKIQYRTESVLKLKDGTLLTMPMLEEILFALQEVNDFDASLQVDGAQECLVLSVDANMDVAQLEKHIRDALYGLVGWPGANGQLTVKVTKQPLQELDVKAMRKRRITDERTTPHQ
jgi:phenylacetate-coenzyme A ligase PaaK-like adenylate-forming protein